MSVLFFWSCVRDFEIFWSEKCGVLLNCPPDQICEEKTGLENDKTSFIQKETEHNWHSL